MKVRRRRKKVDIGMTPPTEITAVRQRPEELRGQVGTCGCGAWWTGQNTSHCKNCHQTFTGVTAFDAHHRGGHKHPSAMPALAIIERSHGQKVWGYPDLSDPDAPKWYDKLKDAG